LACQFNRSSTISLRETPHMSKTVIELNDQEVMRIEATEHV
jgi:hypothetical protein